MLRITQQSQAAGAKSYFAQPDYYTEGQELAGHWGGSGARLLGLEGQVEQEQFHALCDNQRPDHAGMLTSEQPNAEKSSVGKLAAIGNTNLL
jgi:conjugative relaxase-like TrwC/TraI family protein